jgi:hypothetical protein
VRYSVQVPGKRCVAMDCLSGGEAAMASLAFMFALNRCCIKPMLWEMGILIKKMVVQKHSKYIHRF